MTRTQILKKAKQNPQYRRDLIASLSKKAAGDMISAVVSTKSLVFAKDHVEVRGILMFSLRPSGFQPGFQSLFDVEFKAWPILNKQGNIVDWKTAPLQEKGLNQVAAQVFLSSRPRTQLESKLEEDMSKIPKRFLPFSVIRG